MKILHKKKECFMSSCLKMKVLCPQCGKKIDYDYWKSIDIEINPELKEEVFNQNLFRCHCSCGCNDVILHSLIYYNVKNRYMISFCSDDEVEDNADIFYEMENEKSFKDIRLRITTDYRLLLEKIEIFDNNFDDKVIEIEKGIISKAFEQTGTKLKDIAISFEVPNENFPDNHIMVINFKEKYAQLFPIDKSISDKYTTLIVEKEKYADDLYVIDHNWAYWIIGDEIYPQINGYNQILKNYQAEVLQNFKTDFDLQDINKIENDDTLLKLAVIANDYDRVKELLEKGADPNLRIVENRIAMHFALQYGASTEIIDLLIAHGSELNVVAKYKLKPLDIVDVNCSVKYLDYIFSLGAECSKERLISHFASNTHNIDLITYLVNKGFPLDYRDSNDMNVTCEVVCNNTDNDFLDKYLNLYGNPNEKHRGKPCFYDYIGGYYDIKGANGYYAKRLKILFDHGADVNITNNRNQTPMMLACKYARDEYTIRFLLGYNPDLSATDKDGNDVFFYIENNEFLPESEKAEVRQLLENKKWEMINK